MLAIVPGHMAAVFVAFAEIGGIRTKSSAGKEMKLPPPATELIIPATSAAVKRKPASRRDTAKHNVPVFFCHLAFARARQPRHVFQTTLSKK